MVSLAGKRDFTEESQVVEEIRHSCISCHVKFRDNKGREHDLFPNVGNVITGEVGILKLNGEERNDRTNVLVFLDRVKTKSDFLLPRKNPVISQKNRIYSPKVLPVVVGTTVDFPNDDTIFHNVFSLSKTMPFDLDIYRPGNSKSVTFTKTGWVKLYCNIHPKMTANILILDNPFFDLTDQRGIFVIPDVPDGEYTLRVWYETGDEVRKTIKISDALLYEFDFEVHESKRIVEHKTKFGKPYKNKYE